MTEDQCRRCNEWFPVGELDQYRMCLDCEPYDDDFEDDVIQGG